jgi:hypothetical protein
MTELCHFIKSSVCRIRVGQNVVIYGFQFHACNSDKENKIIRPLAMNKYMHYERFTLQFLHLGKCVAQYKFAGRLNYGNKTNFYFHKPFLAIKNSQYDINLEFNHDVKRYYPNYCHEKPTNFDDIFSTETKFYFCCLSQILFKVM